MKTVVIIPNYNGKHFLEKCMQALDKQNTKDFSVFFVDNASSDGSIPAIKEYIEKEPERIFLLENKENYGFAKAVNQGILYAKEHGANYALLLNNDTEVDPRFVENLVRFMAEKEAKGEKVFALSSKMIKMHDERLMDDAGDELCLLGFPFQRGLEDRTENWNKAEKVFSACAGAALYSISALDKTGLFDEKHFAYLEDVDISFRAQLYGYTVNSIFLLYKNFPLFLKIVNFFPFLLGFLIKALYFQKKGYGKAYRKGIMRGLKERKGMKKADFRAIPFTRYIALEWRLLKNCFVYLSERKRRRELKL